MREEAATAGEAAATEASRVAHMSSSPPGSRELYSVASGEPSSRRRGVREHRDSNELMALHISWRFLAWAGAAVLVLACIGLLLMALSENSFGLLDDPADDAGTYFAVFALVFGDAIFAIFPGESTLNTASVLASDGELELGLVIFAGFLGAWLGDNSLYWVVRSVPGFHSRVEKAQEDERFKKIIEMVNQSSFVLVIICRFLPFVRWAVIAGMGALPMALRPLPFGIVHRGHDLVDVYLSHGIFHRHRTRGLPDRFRGAGLRQFSHHPGDRILDLATRSPGGDSRRGVGAGIGVNRKTTPRYGTATIEGLAEIRTTNLRAFVREAVPIGAAFFGRPKRDKPLALDISCECA